MLGGPFGPRKKMKKINDELNKTIRYYQNILLSENQIVLLTRLTNSFDLIKKLDKTNTLDNEMYNQFIVALSDSNEIIWYEVGKILSQYWNVNESIPKIFDESLYSKKGQTRFNVIALVDFFPINFQKNVIKEAIIDKSKKVRLKAADMILTLQNNEYFALLQEVLKSEKDSDVIEAYEFTIMNFNKIKLDKSGNSVFSR
jgi:hypothetical protein